MNIAPYTIKTTSQVAAELTVDSDHGLSEHEAEKRRVDYGSNVLVEHRVTGWSIFLRQFRSSFVYLLIGASVLSFILGEVLDGSMVLLFVLLNTCFGFVQEYRSEKTAALLKAYTVQHARVVRDGEEKRIPSSEVVPGDVVLFEAGDIICADARVVEETNAEIDESALTGESVEVKKTADVLTKATKEVYEAHNIVFSGTSIVSGSLKAIVIATGKESTLGQVATLTTETRRISSFEKEINEFSRFILRLVIVTLILVILMHLAFNHAEHWVDLIVFAIALSVGVIPEGLPVVTTFSLSRGALRLSKQHVVVKRLTAIEDLGGVEVLCTDKTGTLTENVLTVSGVHAKDREKALWYAALAGSQVAHDQSKQANNSFDLAVWKALSKTQQEHVQHTHRVVEIPFDPNRRRNSVVVKDATHQTLIVRGAAEVVVKFCTDLSAQEKKEIISWSQEQGKNGHRTIAVAERAYTKSTVHPDDESHDLKYVGSIAFEDPIKTSTLRAVKDAQKLGVAVKVLTGDSREVAGSVAEKIGLIQDSSAVMLGEELDALSHEEQLEAVKTHVIFARVSPQQKYHIIELLQEAEKQVAFLGEGINDAPALKIANISLVVQGASDIAREAADVILLKQSLEVIIHGIREGRAVFANTMKYIQATLSSNFGNFYAVAIVSLFVNFLPMLPLQILLLNMLSDFPMVTIAADHVDPLQLRKPKSYHVRDILILATLLGVVSTAFDFVYFFVFHAVAPASLQTNWFMGSVLTELLFLFSIRNRGFFWKGVRPAGIIVAFTAVAALITITVPYTSLGTQIFSFVHPTLIQLCTTIGIALVYFCVTEVVKVWYLRRRAVA